MAPRRPRARLTPREVEVIALLADDRTMREAAEVLGIAEGTARAHADNALRGLGVHSMKAAVAIGFREGWLT